MIPDDSECTCEACSLEIEVEPYKDLFFGSTYELPGLLGVGDCEEEAVNDLLEFVTSIPNN